MLSIYGNTQEHQGDGDPCSSLHCQSYIFKEKNWPFFSNIQKIVGSGDIAGHSFNIPLGDMIWYSFE